MNLEAYLTIVREALQKEKMSYNAYRPAGEEDGLVYFRVLHKEYLGKGYKLGLPVYVAIDSNGKYTIVSDYDAGTRAQKREYDLTRKSSTGDTVKDLTVI